MSKLLLVLYTCLVFARVSSSTSSVICEGNQSIVRCPGTQIIKVHDAFYGRDDLSTCGGPAHTVHCRSSVSTGDIKYKCDGKSSCSLSASHILYGDPCPYTRKFIKVTYECRDGGVVICENHERILSCPTSTVMKVQSAFYGRDDPTTCGGPVRTTSCLSAVSENKIKHSCNGRRTCALKASNYLYGDPCYGTLKYIRVIYTCVPE